MRVVALDLSLTACGWARNETELTPAGPRSSGVFKPKGRGTHRLQHALDQVMRLTKDADVVLIENYAYNKGRSAHQVGELGGVVRLYLHQRGTPFIVVAPASLKKVATGKGNAAKELVLAEAVRRLDYQGASFDEAEALWLLQMALQHYGLPGAVDLPKAHLEKLENVEWSDVGALAGEGVG